MQRKIPADKVLNELDEFFSKNDIAGAEKHLLYWLSEAESAADDRALLLLFNELMGFYRKQGDKERAEGFAGRALSQIKKMNISENTGAATTYLNCATVYKAFGRSEDALPLYERALIIYERELYKNDERLAGLYNNMALALVDIKDFRKAEEFYKKALAVLENNKGKEPEQAITYLNLASAAEAELGLEGADGAISEYIKTAQQLLDKCQNEKSGNYAFVCEKCASVFGYYGYFAYENELMERSRRIYEGA